ncbi:hypothetical protein NBRC116601_06800 [Cognatishimia sp. WU-CL00825]|uniref:DUF6477 family protein n=1 Tax=Cognatishimia sp. WU-CL00825 TaxID=3127658 RepID=UPI00310A43FE
MQDVLTTLAQLNRPRILVRTAKAAARDYRRDLHLRHHLKTDHLPRSVEALMKLIEIEQDMNALRQSKDNTYSLVDHVGLLSALIAEAQMYCASRQGLITA